MSGPMMGKAEHITPAVAKEMLSTMRKNRPLSDAKMFPRKLI